MRRRIVKLTERLIRWSESDLEKPFYVQRENILRFALDWRDCTDVSWLGRSGSSLFACASVRSCRNETGDYDVEVLRNVLQVLGVRVHDGIWSGA